MKQQPHVCDPNKLPNTDKVLVIKEEPDGYIYPMTKEAFMAWMALPTADSLDSRAAAAGVTP